jgi:hypothetical protein
MKLIHFFFFYICLCFNLLQLDKLYVEIRSASPTPPPLPIMENQLHRALRRRGLRKELQTRTIFDEISRECQEVLLHHPNSFFALETKILMMVLLFSPHPFSDAFVLSPFPLTKTTIFNKISRGFRYPNSFFCPLDQNSHGGTTLFSSFLSRTHSYFSTHQDNSTKFRDPFFSSFLSRNSSYFLTTRQFST